MKFSSTLISSRGSLAHLNANFLSPTRTYPELRTGNCLIVDAKPINRPRWSNDSPPMTRAQVIKRLAHGCDEISAYTMQVLDALAEREMGSCTPSDFDSQNPSAYWSHEDHGDFAVAWTWLNKYAARVFLNFGDGLQWMVVNAWDLTLVDTGKGDKNDAG